MAFESRQICEEGNPAKFSEMSQRDLQLRTIALLEKIARSQGALERRVEAMELAISQPATSPAISSFPQFRKMPPEIRHRVWSLAIPTRALRLQKSSKSGPMPIMPPPAVAETCREARAVTTQNGGMISLTKCDSKGSSKPYWAWFDGYHDVLELERWVSVETDEPRGIKALVQRARHILVPRADAEWFACLFQQTISLRRVSLKLDAFFVNRCAWEPIIVKELFSDVNTVQVLDLEDASEIARIKAILRHHWRCPFFCEFDLEGWAAARPTTSGASRDEEWMRHLDKTWMSEVARGWVMAKTNTTGAQNTAAQVRGMNVEDACVRTALAGMPDVRLVRAYLLADIHSTG